jgi:hypothetical protein
MFIKKDKRKGRSSASPKKRKKVPRSPLNKERLTVDSLKRALSGSKILTRQTSDVVDPNAASNRRFLEIDMSSMAKNQEERLDVFVDDAHKYGPPSTLMDEQMQRDLVATQRNTSRAMRETEQFDAAEEPVETVHTTVSPKSTVIGSDLDALESAFRKIQQTKRGHQRFENVLEPRVDPFQCVDRTSLTLPVEFQEECLPAEMNPHFPLENIDMNVDGSNELVLAMSTKNCSQNTPGLENEPFSAFNPRPVDTRRVAFRPLDFWDDPKNRQFIEEINAYKTQDARDKILEEGIMDTSLGNQGLFAVRWLTMKFFQRYAINEMIQEGYCTVRQIEPGDGSPTIRFDPAETGVIPILEAIRIARAHDLDLIRSEKEVSQDDHRRAVAICIIGDHRQMLRDHIKFSLGVQGGVQTPIVRECVEVPFKGVTRPDAVRFKAIGVAKHLLLNKPVRVNLTKFGTPREGFPALQFILDEIKLQCTRLNAFHTVSGIHCDFNEIWCFLHPSTAKSPKTSIVHPSPEEIHQTMENQIMQNEKEIYFDDYYNKSTMKERLRYATKLVEGTAWADKDDGLSMQEQRRLKLRLGYLPKGNNKLYAARGDVDWSPPFRASHMTSTEKFSYPRETNLEKASRGAAVLGHRSSMNISEMHDQGETAENSSLIDRFYYRMSGQALEVGHLKEALGLKNNRKKTPALGPGWATLGSNATSAEPSPYAAK